MIKIGQGSGWYRPYITNVNNVSRTVEEIRFYSEEGTVLVVGQGWLSRVDGGDIKEIELNADELLLRRKEKLDGEVFIMSKKNDYSYSDEKECVLYIPNSLANFKRVGRELKYGDTVVDRWVSEVLQSEYTVHRHDLRVNEGLKEIERRYQEIMKDNYNLSIDKSDIIEKLDKLKELKVEYDKEKERIKQIDINSLP